MEETPGGRVMRLIEERTQPWDPDPIYEDVYGVIVEELEVMCSFGLLPDNLDERSIKTVAEKLALEVTFAFEVKGRKRLSISSSDQGESGGTDVT